MCVFQAFSWDADSAWFPFDCRWRKSANQSKIPKQKEFSWNQIFWTVFDDMEKEVKEGQEFVKSLVIRSFFEGMIQVIEKKNLQSTEINLKCVCLWEIVQFYDSSRT